MTNGNDTEKGKRMVQVLVPIGDGSEEIETACITDTLTRFGANVVTASVGTVVKNDDPSVKSVGNKNIVKMSCGLQIVADINIDQAIHMEWDLIVCPGGIRGALSLKNSKTLTVLLRRQHERKKLLAGVCAAPSIVLASAGIYIEGATCYPYQMLRNVIINPSTQDVVVNKHIVTATGPGTTVKFSLTLGKLLFGFSKAREVAQEMLAFDFDQADAILEPTNEPKQESVHYHSDEKMNITSANVKSLDKPSGDQTISNKSNQSNSVERNHSTPVQHLSEETMSQNQKRKYSSIDNTSPRKKTLKTITPEKKNIARSRHNKNIFFQVIWPSLEKSGFVLMKGNRPSDKYIFPPGITKENGRVRKDYFDSFSQVLTFLETKEEYQNIYKLYVVCIEVHESRTKKGKKSQKNFPLKVLRQEVVEMYPSFESIFPPID